MGMREENSPIAFMSKIPAICSGPVEQAIRAWALLIKEIKPPSENFPHTFSTPAM
jgi:hypothetical protein